MLVKPALFVAYAKEKETLWSLLLGHWLSSDKRVGLNGGRWAPVDSVESVNAGPCIESGDYAFWPSSFETSVRWIGIVPYRFREELLKRKPETAEQTAAFFALDVQTEEGLSEIMASLLQEHGDARENSSVRLSAQSKAALGSAVLAELEPFSDMRNDALLPEVRSEIEARRHEPFFAAIRMRSGALEGVRTLFICRGYTPPMRPVADNAMFVNKWAPLGEALSLPLFSRSTFGEVFERAEFRPHRAEEGTWDVQDFIYRPEEPIRREVSLRRYLDGLDDGDPSRLRPVVTKLELPDVLILTHEQDRLVRLPLRRRLVFDGRAGTGKTTVLAKRLAMKCSAEVLRSDEYLSLSEGVLRALREGDGWHCFVRTRGMVGYIQNALRAEGLDPTKNVSDWDTFFRDRLQPSLEKMLGGPVAYRGFKEADSRALTRCALGMQARIAKLVTGYGDQETPTARAKDELQQILEGVREWQSELDTEILPKYEPADSGNGRERFRPKSAQEPFEISSQLAEHLSKVDVIRKELARSFSYPQALLLFYGVLLIERSRSGDPQWRPRGVFGDLAGWIRPMVFVDEGAEFHPLELACMELLTPASTSSFTVTGDPSQTLSRWGARSWADAESLIPGLQVCPIREVHRHTARLNALCTTLRLRGGNSDTGSGKNEPPSSNAVGGPPPVRHLAQGVSETAAWLRDRIDEIEALEGTLPSTAVIEASEGACEALLAALRKSDSGRQSRYEVCVDGVPRSAAARVRVVPLRAMKGLEFEAAFICGVDKWPEGDRERIVYAAASRARRYVGVTYSSWSARGLAGFLDLFPEERWRQ